MNRTEIERKTEQLVQPLVDAHGFELVDVEYVKEGSTWYLRAYIDKPGGINVDDCELISRALEQDLDREDFIADAYVLEVSSPGLGRAIRKEKDLIRNQDKEVELRLYRAIEGEKEFRGILKNWTDSQITIVTEDERELTFTRKEIALLKEAFDW